MNRADCFGDMRSAAEEWLGTYSKYHSVAGSAEQTTLAEHSIDLVVAAQAFHWFDAPAARREFERILRPRGAVVLLWNERKLDASPFLIAYESLLRDISDDDDDGDRRRGRDRDRDRDRDREGEGEGGRGEES